MSQITGGVKRKTSANDRRKRTLDRLLTQKEKNIKDFDYYQNLYSGKIKPKDLLEAVELAKLSLDDKANHLARIGKNIDRINKEIRVLEGRIR